jgi:chloride channel protein, CIC family
MARRLTKTQILLFAILLGLLGGLIAILFHGLVAFIHNLLFLRTLSFNYHQNIHTTSIWGVAVILLPIIGAPFVIWFIEKFARNQKGLSVPNVMYAIHCKVVIIRPIAALAKTIASSISLGSGGSLGEEGPMLQLGASLGTIINNLLAIATEQRIILTTAGASAATAALFNAPLGGAIFVLELTLLPMRFFNLLVLFIASFTATGITYLAYGSQIFLSLPSFPAISLMQELLFIPFGIVLGLISIIFIRGLYFLHDIFSVLKNVYLRHIFGMLLVGILLYVCTHFFNHYYIAGTGYATIQDLMYSVIKSPWLLLLLFFGKLLATCLTLGTGASGGIFSSSLLLGALLGTLTSLFCNYYLPHLNIPPIIFVVAGMAGMTGSVTGAQIATIVIIFEMANAYQLILPMIITTIVAYQVRRILCRDSIYTLKLTRQNINYRGCYKQKIQE